MRISALLLTALASLATLAPVPADEEIKSGPQAGAVLPGPFDAFNVNGKRAKGRFHCLVCEFGLNPVVMVFAREPGEGKEGSLHALLKKLDEAVEKHQSRFLSSFAVFLSPDARSSATDPKEDDPGKLVAEAEARDALLNRLDELVKKQDFKHLVVTCFPREGPKGYHINDKAEVTVVFYNKHKVIANFSFAAGTFKEENIDPILQKVEATLAEGQKKAPTMKKL